MTSRAGAKQFMNRVARTFYDCVLLKVVRRDGVTVRITNHDRTLTFEGEEYTPLLLADLSAERREGGLRSGNQEARTTIDGSTFTVPDMVARRWIGAEVFQVRTDWRMPWQWISKDRKWVRQADWSGGAMLCTLEGRTQVLTRPAGGRFAGTFATVCPYTLGDPLTCKKDVSIGSGFAGAGARVATIVKQRKQATFVVSTWPVTATDGFFRDGSFEWMWAAAVESGLTTVLTSDNVVTDATQTWATNVHVGKWVRILTGAGGSVLGESFAKIVANNATQLFYDDNLPMAGHAVGSVYDIVPECDNVGVVSPIVYYVHATRDITLLFPTPFDIAVGDSGIWRAGCDGLLPTCGGKFGDANHPLNFGGDPFQPSAQAIIEPPEGIVIARSKFIDAVEALVGTPVVHGGRLAGVGVDCIGVPLVALAACGSTTTCDDGYPRLPDDEQLRDGLLRYCDQVVPGERMMAGDLLQVYFGKKARHVMVFVAHAATGQPIVVHASGRNGSVRRTTIGPETKVRAVWRIREVEYD